MLIVMWRLRSEKLKELKILVYCKIVKWPTGIKTIYEINKNIKM